MCHKLDKITSHGFPVIMIIICNVADQYKNTPKKYTWKYSLEENSRGGFCPAGSETHLSPGGIHRLSFYRISKIGRNLFISVTIHLPGGWCDNPGVILMSRSTLSHITRHFRLTRAPYEPALSPMSLASCDPDEDITPWSPLWPPLCPGKQDGTRIE